MSSAKKVLLIYLLFGLGISAFITFSGAYTNLVVNSSMGAMSVGTYTGIMGLVTVGWLPICISILISSVKYLQFPAGRILPLLVISLFIACCRICVKKKR